MCTQIVSVNPRNLNCHMIKYLIHLFSSKLIRNPLKGKKRRKRRVITESPSMHKSAKSIPDVKGNLRVEYVYSFRILGFQIFIYLVVYQLQTKKLHVALSCFLNLIS